jgi:hypothetical protein
MMKISPPLFFLFPRPSITTLFSLSLSPKHPERERERPLTIKTNETGMANVHDLVLFKKRE